MNKEVPVIGTEQVIEDAIVAAGKTGARVTPDQIDFVINNIQYHVFPGTMVTVCCLTLRNGYNVIGESACASPENFDEVIGQNIAYKNAREKIWALEGYLLKEKLFSLRSNPLAAEQLIAPSQTHG